MPVPTTANFGWPKPDPANVASLDAGRIADAFDAIDALLAGLAVGSPFTASSTTALAIGTGTRIFAVGAGRGFAAGDYVLATSAADAAKYLHGRVVSYAGTSLTVDVTDAGGSGTVSDWLIRISGQRGPSALLGPQTRVRFRTTANVDLAGGGLAGGTVHDGVTAAAGDIVFVAAQTAPAEQGIYVVPATGAAARSTEFDSWEELTGVLISVAEGTAWHDTVWLLTVDAGGTLGTDPVTFDRMPDAAQLAFRVRVDAAQAFTAAEQSQGLANLGFVGRNLLINPHGRINQRQPASNADDTYGHDRWVALTQTGTIAVSTLTAVEDGTPSMMRLTQSQATAQRMGYAQIIEGANCKHLRGKAVVLGGRLRYSNAAAVRYAILEWTGTEDTVTSDVVLDWTSATFTAGNFFLASNLTVRAVGSLTPAAATLADLTALTATLGSTFNNLIVFIWTEGTAAQNATLDLSLHFERGALPTEREFRPAGIELALCQRTFERIDVVDGTDLGVGSALNTGIASASFGIVPKRVAPTFSYSNLSHFKIRIGGGAFVTGLTSISAVSTVNGQTTVNATKAAAFTTADYTSFQGAAAGYVNFDAEL